MLTWTSVCITTIDPIWPNSRIFVLCVVVQVKQNSPSRQRMITVRWSVQTIEMINTLNVDKAHAFTCYFLKKTLFIPAALFEGKLHPITDQKEGQSRAFCGIRREVGITGTKLLIETCQLVGFHVSRVFSPCCSPYLPPVLICVHLSKQMIHWNEWSDFNHSVSNEKDKSREIQRA